MTLLMTHQTHHQLVTWQLLKRVFRIANQNSLQPTNQQKLSPSLNQEQIINQLHQWHNQPNQQSISWQQANEECPQCQTQFIHLIHWIDPRSILFDHHHITLLLSNSKLLWMLFDKIHFSYNGKYKIKIFQQNFVNKIMPTKLIFKCIKYNSENKPEVFIHIFHHKTTHMVLAHQ